MVGDFPAVRRNGTIDCWALCAFTIHHLCKVLASKPSSPFYAKDTFIDSKANVAFTTSFKIWLTSLHVMQACSPLL